MFLWSFGPPQTPDPKREVAGSRLLEQSLGLYYHVATQGGAHGGEVLGNLREPWGALGKMREYWGLLGYPPAGTTLLTNLLIVLSLVSLQGFEGLGLFGLRNGTLTTF